MPSSCNSDNYVLGEKNVLCGSMWDLSLSSKKKTAGVKTVLVQSEETSTSFRANLLVSAPVQRLHYRLWQRDNRSAFRGTAEERFINWR